MTNHAHLTEARTALQKAEHPILLHGEKNALLIYGPLWFATLDKILAKEFPDKYLGIEVDAGDRADLAHEALRIGLKRLIFSGHQRAAIALQDIAFQRGAKLTIKSPDT